MPKYKVFVCFEDTFETEVNASCEEEAADEAIMQAESVLRPTADVELIEEDDPDEEKPEPPMEGQICLFSEEADHAKP